MKPMHILITGCSGGGKSTLLGALGRRGYATIPEPGRRIVAEEVKGRGAALPWIDLAAFARRAYRIALTDLRHASSIAGPVFFDRGVVDAAVALEFAGVGSYRALLAGERHYARRVFLAPPWPDIFVADSERRHSFADATSEYLRLERAFRALGYETVTLPKSSTNERVDFVLDALGLS